MAEKISKRTIVKSTTKKIIRSFSETLDTSSTKAQLAELRNSLGRPWDQSLAALQIVFENIPEEISGKSRILTNEELAIFSTVQLYALYQQSKSESLDFDGKEGEWNNIGNSLSTLRTEDAGPSTDQRFNAMITSQSFPELITHLRHMLKLLKAKNQDVKINFAQLSQDLYDFLNGYQDSLKLNWSRAYYSRKNSEKNKDEQNGGKENDK